MNFLNKISRAGIILLAVGIGLLCVSAGDTITSFKTPLSVEDLMDDVGVKPGDHVQGKVPLLLDSFAIEQTWTENKSTNSRTAKKTSHGYYVMVCWDGNMALSVGSADISAAESLVDQTYGYMESGNPPVSSLEIDGRVVKMSDDLAELYRDEMLSYYNYTEAELAEMGTLLLVEGRAFTVIRIFCAVGAVFLIVGLILLINKWRKASAVSADEELYTSVEG